MSSPRLAISTTTLFARSCFFFNDPAPTETYPLSLHDALPISPPLLSATLPLKLVGTAAARNELPLAGVVTDAVAGAVLSDRKSTRLNSSHTVISYAVFCLKKKKTEVRGFNRRI